MEKLGWLEALGHGREGLRCVSTTCGHPFATVVGVPTMLKLCAANLATLEQVHILYMYTQFNTTIVCNDIII